MNGFSEKIINGEYNIILICFELKSNICLSSDRIRIESDQVWRGGACDSYLNAVSFKIRKIPLYSSIGSSNNEPFLATTSFKFTGKPGIKNVISGGLVVIALLQTFEFPAAVNANFIRESSTGTNLFNKKESASNPIDSRTMTEFEKVVSISGSISG